MKTTLATILMVLSCFCSHGRIGLAQVDDVTTTNDQPPIPMAILPFREQGATASAPRAGNFGDAARENSEKSATDVAQSNRVSSLLFAELAVDSNLVLVEREDIDKMIEELELSAAGMVDSQTANRIGHMIGAKILVTGSVLKVDDSLFVIAKIIGTETTRVFGASAKGRFVDGLTPLVEQVAKQIAAKVSSQGEELLPKPVTKEYRLEELRKRLPKTKLPSLAINIEEQHLGARVIDPAAETEYLKTCAEVGFTVYDASTPEGKKADLTIIGEAISEPALRRKHFHVVKARIEVKVIENSTGKILIADRETSVWVDLSENVTAKSAIQNAALQTIERVLPKIANLE